MSLSYYLKRLCKKSVRKYLVKWEETLCYIIFQLDDVECVLVLNVHYLNYSHHIVIINVGFDHVDGHFWQYCRHAVQIANKPELMVGRNEAKT